MLIIPLDIPENVRSIDQAYGSATTLQRRYEAMACWGLVSGDGRTRSEPQEEQKPKTIVASEAQVSSYPIY